MYRWYDLTYRKSSIFIKKLLEPINNLNMQDKGQYMKINHFVYTSNEPPESETKKTIFYNGIKKNKIPGNKFNLGSVRFAH